MTRFSPLVLLLIVVVAVRSDAGDWPQWRGPDRSDVSTETELLSAWPEGGPPRVWLFRDAGIGYSGVAVMGDLLYTAGARDDVEQLICVNVQDGTEVWSADIGELYENGWGDGPRGTPTVAGDRVFALGGKGDLICVAAADGKLLWKANLLEAGGSIPNWGYTESVLVDGNQVICTPGGDQGTVLALDKSTGEKLWQSDEWTDKAQYSSPIVAVHNGTRQYIQMTQESVASVEAATGKLLWRTDWPGRVAVVPTPIYRDGYVYVTSGYGVGCNLYRLEDNNTVTEVYGDDAKKVMKNHHGGALLLGDYVYGHSDRVGWVCQNFETGEQMWRERSKLGKGAVTCAGGMLYCISEDEGEVALVKATPDGWTEAGRFTLEPQTELRKPRGRIWTHPVVANGKLYLRDQELLFCFDVSRK